ncbi:MAG: 4'-phosphopantetheinyl transferase superfamily protein, partial [Planctomycetia bacterium]
EAAVGAEQVDAFFRIWTRKEAYVKGVGAGLHVPLDQFVVIHDAGSTDALRSTAYEPADLHRWRLLDLPPIDGYIAAVAVARRDSVFETYDWASDAKDG